MGDRLLVERVLVNHQDAAIDVKFRAMLGLVEKAATHPASVAAADVEAVRAAGWDDEAIYDAVTVCALFGFYTTWVDATGVPGLTDYGPSGQRLLLGYVPQKPDQ